MCGSPLKFRCRQLTEFQPSHFRGPATRWDRRGCSHFKTCNLSYRCFRYHVRHFNFQLNTAEFQQVVRLSAAMVTSALSKISEARLHSFPLVKYASWFKGYQIYHFSTKNSSAHLRFWCRHSITSWTISGISTSFHPHQGRNHHWDWGHRSPQLLRLWE